MLFWSTVNGNSSYKSTKSENKTVWNKDRQGSTNLFSKNQYKNSIKLKYSYA